MEKEKMRRITKEALLARAEAARESKPQYRDYESKLLGATLTIKRLPSVRICELMDLQDDDSMKSNMELNTQVIYESIPLLQDKELQDAYGCVEPYEIVAKVLEDNMGEMQRLCKFILGAYGMGEMVEEVKN